MHAFLNNALLMRISPMYANNGEGYLVIKLWVVKARLSKLNSRTDLPKALILQLSDKD